MTRTEIILELLEHLADYEQPPGRTGTGNNDDAYPGMPPMYRHPSVRELYRTLERLRLSDHTAWAHTIAYYKCEWRTVDTARRRRDKRGRQYVEPGPRKRERILNGWILDPCVTRGRTYIVNNFQGDPFLPSCPRCHRPAFTECECGIAVA